MIDAPHDVDAIMQVVGDRNVKAIVCTHAHDDHVRVAPQLSERTGAPVLLHPDDAPVWNLTHPDRPPDGELSDGLVLSIGGTEIRVMHTPGHAPGAVCLYAPTSASCSPVTRCSTADPAQRVGRTQTSRPSSRPIDRLIAELPGNTTVHPGHGDSTTLDAESPHRQEWLDRGH